MSTVVDQGDCRVVDEFDDAGRWAIVNDGVMGGRSQGFASVADGVIRFAGTIVTAGGGFTSLRLPLRGDELAGGSGIEIRARTDGRIYALTLADGQTINGRRISHGGDLRVDQSDADGWVTMRLDFADLRPSIFGRTVEAEAFEPDAATEFGIILSDGVDGDFELIVDRIDVCRDV